MPTDEIIRDCVARARNRTDLWTSFLKQVQARRVAEVGVYKGDFAAALLRQCDFIEAYYMLDPWRNLDDWNKPANVENDLFAEYLRATLEKTEFAAEKRIILRGKTTEIADGIEDGNLDFAYIDGDHTLRGITIDLIRLLPKVRNGGWVGGDDFTRSIWQHSTAFEPTLVFPFAVYFAEAVGARIYALPYGQFLMQKGKGGDFAFVDLDGRYDDTTLRDQLHPDRFLKMRLAEAFPSLYRLAGRVKRMAGR